MRLDHFVNPGVNNVVQGLLGGLIAEYDGAQGLPVDLAVGHLDGGPELPDNVVISRLAPLDHLASNLVGIHDPCPSRG